MWLSALGSLRLFSSPITVLWGKELSGYEGMMPFPVSLSCKCVFWEIFCWCMLMTSVVMLRMLLWCFCQLQHKATTAKQSCPLVWDEITRTKKNRKVSERGTQRERKGGDGWADCAQSPWQPLWHAAAIPAANIGALLNHLCLCIKDPHASSHTDTEYYVIIVHHQSFSPWVLMYLKCLSWLCLRVDVWWKKLLKREFFRHLTSVITLNYYHALKWRAREYSCVLPRVFRGICSPNEKVW